MKLTENIERLMQSVRVKTSASVDERILTDSIQALAKASHEPPATGRILKIGKFIMHNRTSRFAAAAVVIAAVGFASWIVLSNGASTAYAFTQTVQAMHSVETLHLKSKGNFFGGHPGELWAEFDSSGQLVRCRMEWPQTEDGHKVVFYHDNKVDVWFKNKNVFATYALGQQVAQKVLAMAVSCDPKRLVGRLEQDQTQGKVRIDTQTPAGAGALIVLTVTHLPPSGAEGRREILRVDPVTKLVRQIENLRMVDGEYQSQGLADILEYNQPIDPAVYHPQLPEGIMRIDQTTQQIGLPKGEMTDEQVAKEVVRQFFEALIAKDYAKAGQLFSGMPAADTERVFGRMHVLRIISIGGTTPHPLSHSLRVSCRVEIEMGGQTEIKDIAPFVRPVESQPDHWNISGGI